MTSKIIIAGFGGQGVMLTGKLLAYAAMMEGKEVTHFASYGAEMRGGTCNCFVIISDKQIASPIIIQPDILMVLNTPSLIKFEPKCIQNGTLILNSSLINKKVNRPDLSIHEVDATNVAEKLGNVRSTNMVMLGGLIKLKNLVKLDTIIDSLKEVISSRHKALLDINANALREGFNLAK